MAPPSTDAGRVTRRRALRRARAGLLGGLVAIALVAGGCAANAASSDGIATLASVEPGGSATPSASPVDPQEAFLQFTQCMRDHGIDMPDPQTGPGGGQTGTVEINPKNEAGFQAADTACRHFLAGITRDAGGKQMSAEEQQAFLDFAACMRDHGVAMADPQFESGGMSIRIGGDDGEGAKIDPQSPAFKNAEDACQHILTDAGIDKPGAGSTSVDGESGAEGGAAPAGPNQKFVTGGNGAAGQP